MIPQARRRAAVAAVILGTAALWWFRREADEATGVRLDPPATVGPQIASGPAEQWPDAGAAPPLTAERDSDGGPAAQSGATIEGRLVDEHGAPWAGWRVWVSLPADPSGAGPFRPAIAETTTGEEGHFELSRIPSGSWVVSGMQRSPVIGGPPGVVSARIAQREQLVAGAERVYLELVSERGLEVKGTVVSSHHAPQPRVPVLATGPGPTGVIGAVTLTDAQGAFGLSGFRAGRVQLKVELRGWQPVRTVVDAGATDVRLTLSPAPRARGRLVDLTHQPIAEFEIDGRQVQSADGTFDVELESGSTPMLVFRAPGYARRAVDLPNPPPVSELGDVVLSRGRRLTGRVFDADTGLPIPGAAAAARQAARVADPDAPLLPSEGAATTGADGEFVLTDVPDDADELAVANHPWEDRRLALAPGQSRIEVGLRRGGRVEVRVVDAHGRNATGFVHGFGPDQRHAMRSMSATSPARFEGLVSGAWTFRPKALAAGFWRPLTLDVAANTERQVVLREAQDAVVVRCEVVGTPIGEATVILLGPSEPPPADARALAALKSMGAPCWASGTSRAPPGNYLAIATRTSSGVEELLSEPVSVGSEPRQLLTLGRSGSWRELPP